MENSQISELTVSQGHVVGLKFGLLTARDMGLFSNIVTNEINDLTGPKLGVPNCESSPCSTCGSSKIKHCDGHHGYIELPAYVCHPYSIPILVRMLNKLCPCCKSFKFRKRTKDTGLDTVLKTKKNSKKNCKYCSGKPSGRYPQPKFKYKRRTLQIVATVDREKFVAKYQREKLPNDYWDFLPEDQQYQNYASFEVTLSPYQVYCLIKDIHPDLLAKLALRMELLFIRRFPVTPNCSRVMEIVEDGSPSWHFDDLTKAYKRLLEVKRQVDMVGPRRLQSHYSAQDSSIQSEVGGRLWDCIKLSKLFSKKSSESKSDSLGSGLRWVKDVLLGKRSDNALRMVVVGDPKIGVGEIGIPANISGELVVHEHVNSHNLKRLQKYCGRARVIHKDGSISVRVKQLQVGDGIDRPLEDGDIVLVNRPPSVHCHSLVTLFVKILLKDSVVSINPLTCAPLKGDFDGDCLHGFIPQSVECRVELSELTALGQQLLNEQDGHNLLSLTHDSLTAAHLVRQNDVFLTKFQMQQLEMLVHRRSTNSVIHKAPLSNGSLWTGKQLFSLFLPQDFEFASAACDVHIKDGNLLTCSAETAWLRNTRGSLFDAMLKKYHSQALELLFAAQDVLCEWISMRGLSVSLLDVYLVPHSSMRKRINELVGLGLQELGCISHNKAVSRIVSAHREVNHYFQKIICNLANNDNSMLAMITAGSNGNLTKLVQQSLCLGLQLSAASLSFRISSKFDSASQNHLGIPEFQQKSVNHALVRSSFLDGLNPLECFIHVLSTRGTLFSDNADLPGTLTRKLMFYMRDLYVAYDGTVRNAYGNKVIAFSYGLSGGKTASENSFTYGGEGGKPVGALAATSISEAAYGALDHTIGTTEASLVIQLKKLLESSGRGSFAARTISLYLSDELRRWNCGLENGALKVKGHLESVSLCDIVSSVMIVFSQQDYFETRMSQWVIHFHICQNSMKNRELCLEGIVDILSQEYESSRREARSILPKLQVSSEDCSLVKCGEDEGCFTVNAALDEIDVTLEHIQDILIPILLKTVIKGFLEFKKVEILWEDHNKSSKFTKDSSGALFLKVHLSEHCPKANPWSTLQNACIQIMDLIDWQRSHPTNIHDISCALGINSAWTYFLRALRSTTAEVGRTIHEAHLLLVADCLSVTGEFHGLNAKGIKNQRDQMAISSPFMQACFSNPSSQFIKSAIEETEDDLLGALDAVAWGKQIPLGTGGPFDILYSRKEQNLVEPIKVYETLFSTQCASREHDISDRHSCREAARCFNHERISSLENGPSPVDIVGMQSKFQDMLGRYPVNGYVNKMDKLLLMKALFYHPQANTKMGSGVRAIKVGRHPSHKSRCFMVVREDGTMEDFSYRKCVINAAKQISPELEMAFREKLCGGNMKG